jgi:hypothetical protein
MFKYIKETLKQFSIKTKEFNEIYIDYILCITFLSVILFKLNKISFQLPIIYLYPTIILISILFINQWFFITNKIKNTYSFNWFLYYFLLFKNNVYGIIFAYFDYVEYEKSQKLMIFLTGFVLSNWALNLFFLILNNSYDLSILLFLILLLLNIFNLIEKKLIFTPQNIDQNQNNINYDNVKTILKITNKDFNKNKSMFYIQRRYVNLKAMADTAKKHAPTVLSSIATGTFISAYIQNSSVEVQREQLDHQKQQDEIKQQQNEKKIELQKQLAERKFEYQKQMDLKQDEVQKKLDMAQAERLKQLDIENRQKWLEEYKLKQNELEFKKLQAKHKTIDDIDQKIDKYQANMNTSNFWNKIDHSSQIDSLKEKKSKIENDYKELGKTNINDNSFFED